VVGLGVGFGVGFGVVGARVVAGGAVTGLTYPLQVDALVIALIAARRAVGESCFSIAHVPWPLALVCNSVTSAALRRTSILSAVPI
jgi:hypothetical protein